MVFARVLIGGTHRGHSVFCWPAHRVFLAASRVAGILISGLVLAGKVARAVVHCGIIVAQSALLPGARRSLARDSVPPISHLVVLVCGLVLAAPTIIAASDHVQKPAERGFVSPAASVATGPSKPRHWFELSAAAGPTIYNDLTPPPAPAPVVAAAAPPAPPAPAPPVAPRPSVPASPPPAGSGDGVAAIQAAFADSPGVSWALRVAKCESGYNPRAYNAASGASGLFQFLPSTWNANFPGWNIWDPNAQARAARIFYDQGRTNAWVCK